ncbi:GatB/YqeY domain-containing protein [Ferrovibrio terrae]|uniref:GatB/YqeY domain-containing protein n=1 Tax=Ferrovibrio terrae TaxID=2594003 RepID=A0A516H6S2_9PROT|nr:GatB/YqeY domain-containing protein [Ferrovibrio terrae]QDO99474.1 GatB/YqeY domain-containing protein [Ferrovibrio terrae]
MLRETLNQALKDAMKAKDARRLATLRLILAALKDRDIAARTSGDDRTGIPDEAILGLLQTMVKQRRESITLYEQGNRPELAAQEKEEIAVIESYLPKQMSEAEIEAAARAAIAEVGAQGIKDMGKAMAILKAKYTGQMDSAKTAAILKGLLS